MSVYSAWRTNPMHLHLLLSLELSKKFLSLSYYQVLLNISGLLLLWKNTNTLVKVKACQITVSCQRAKYRDKNNIKSNKRILSKKIQEKNIMYLLTFTVQCLWQTGSKQNMSFLWQPICLKLVNKLKSYYQWKMAEQIFLLSDSYLKYKLALTCNWWKAVKSSLGKCNGSHMTSRKLSATHMGMKADTKLYFVHSFTLIYSW